MARFDGRKENELRELEAQVGVLHNADGSAYFRMGKTVALAAVYIKPSRAERGMLNVRYHMLPFAVPERKSLGISRREMELSYVIAKALEPAIFLEELPNTQIEATIEIIQADAGTRVTAINALSLALAQAGIPMKALVGAVAVGKVGERLVVDLNKKEEDYNSEKMKSDPNLREYYDYYGEGEATDMPIAMYREKVTSMQMDGKITRDEAKQLLELAKEAIRKINEVQKRAIEDFYNV